MSDIAKDLAEVFQTHSNERICVLGTTCCGKSTLHSRFPETIDMDDALWPTLTKEEEVYICSKPWTSDIGLFTKKLVRERVSIFPGRPLFSLILLDCDVIVYLNISEETLRKHCALRGASFCDAMRIKRAIERSVDRQIRAAGTLAYEFTIDE